MSAAIDAKMPHDSHSGQSFLRTLKPSFMYGCRSGIIAAPIRSIKAQVQSSSLIEFVELSIARSSQLASDCTWVTFASILATASFCLAWDFSDWFFRNPITRLPNTGTMAANTFWPSNDQV